MPTTFITDLTFTGEGIGREQGKVVFLPYTLPGEWVEWERVEARKSFDRGRPVRILEPSPFRVEPPCPFFTRCGGCQWQHLKIEKQGEEKERIFRQIMSHRLKTESISLMPSITSRQGFGYRHRLRLKTARKGKRLDMGFYHRASHELTPIDRCLLANEALNEVLPLLRETLEGLSPKEGEPEVDIQILESPKKGGVILTFPHHSPGLHRRRELTRHLLALPGVSYVLFRIKGSSRRLREHPFDPGRDAPEYTLPSAAGRRTPELILTVFPEVFSQASLTTNRLLIERLQSLDIFEEGNDLLDLYCGMGNLSLPLSPLFRQVVGIEFFPPAVTNAEWNRKRNGISNCSFRIGTAGDVLPLLSAETHPKWVFLDPPRSGAEEVTSLLTSSSASIRGILYLSCNPMTLARDLAQLVSHGWKIQWFQLVDFFPQTFHQEALAGLTR